MAMRLLIHKTDHLGDFALALPVLWECRQRWGEHADLHILVQPPNTEWSDLLPWLGTLHPINHPRYHRGTGSEKSAKLMQTLAALRAVRQLRHAGLDKGFDWGIDLVSSRNDLLGKCLLHAAGCRHTSGPDGAYSWLLGQRHPEPKAHQTRILASRFPAEWAIHGTTRPVDFMPPSLRWKGETDGPILLAPFAGTPAKAWPMARWRDLFDQLKASAERRRVDLLVPAPDAIRNGDFLRTFPGAPVRMVGSLRSTISALRDASLVVCLDTAVAHFAWLTGTPSVQLFAGTTPPDRWAPQEGATLLHRFPDCHPCHSETCRAERHFCMEDLDVKSVAQAVRDRLATLNGGPLA